MVTQVQQSVQVFICWVAVVSCASLFRTVHGGWVRASSEPLCPVDTDLQSPTESIGKREMLTQGTSTVSTVETRAEHQCRQAAALHLSVSRSLCLFAGSSIHLLKAGLLFFYSSKWPKNVWNTFYRLERWMSLGKWFIDSHVIVHWLKLWLGSALFFFFLPTVFK